jgi:transcriptional regulator with XRE-family HTH domain
MNALGDLLRSRRDTLRGRGVSVRAIAKKAGLPESTVYEHLKKTQPVKGMPQRVTLEKLAKGFDLPVSDLMEAAKESVGPLRGDPLQLLIRSRQLELGRDARAAVRVAKKKGQSISPATISAVLSGEHANITEPTVAALAAGFELDPALVRAAAAQSAARTSYRLPAHLEDQLTPERWAKIVRIVEDILTVE